ncbi:putative OPA3-like protein CG13603 [Nilaparvata lugens]|uniref:putative OPA3-like protein CG13603 n=1 Tax=Nilaparvata lugens TaxID=108931 RepID=UPI00193CFCA9|nr:putative OPA3-like protein CG13603 [Nilaparvata lugens]
MVLHAFPLAKLGALLLRQVSKPIANFLKERAKQHPFFRTYLLMPPAQFYNWCEVKMKMWVLNLGKPVQVPPLNEAMAIDLGANVLGEGIVFIVAAGIVGYEYNRQVRKEAAKEAARKEEMSVLNYTIQELYFQIEQQSAQLRELHRTVHSLEGKALQKPWKFISSKEGDDTSKPPPKPPTSPPITPISSPISSPTSGPISSPPAPQIIDNKHSHSHHHHYDHATYETVPMHLEHINRVVVDEPGVILNAVSYLTNDIFNFKNDYFRVIHLQDER